MIILALNAGSSSLKFAVCCTDSKTLKMEGIVEKIGTPDIFGELKMNGSKFPLDIQGEDHQAAIQVVLSTLEHELKQSEQSIEAIGHRVVHGADIFHSATLIDTSVIASIEQLSPLAPLHNPANLAVIKAATALYPTLPQVAVFDTAFHQSMPEKAYRYAVPSTWFNDYKVRKYGFHGTSHSYVSSEAIRRFGLCPETSNIIVAHLGNGASATAIRGGISLDTTMGISPLDGLVMGTRSGTVDPSLHSYLKNAAGLSVEEVTDTLTKRSGMLALSEASSDMRDIWSKHDQGDTKAQIAMEVYSYRLAKEVLGLLAAFPSKVDALLFTGGIGENDRRVRAGLLESLTWIGFEIDHELNQKGGDDKGIITKSMAPFAAVIETQEELEIALQTEALCQ
ncbi:acetate/propionate family kinase [Rubritalea sp.]|uniref:acetate/propionate family kinase n=1 Tax=Rubritalea sp. TaxID=2109375 RepID=UPI003EF668CF